MKKELPQVTKNGVYSSIRDMAITFQFPPGERINEGLLAKELGVSRTPIRESMQRLVSEKLLRWERNKGFFCRLLDEKEILDLYEFRRLIEDEVTSLACERASDKELHELKVLVTGSSNTESLDKKLQTDQLFHEKIAEISGNKELLAALKRINQRIYFVRWIDISKHGSARLNKHQTIVDALINRDADSAVKAMSSHIVQHLEQLSELIKEGYGLIYTGKGPKLPHNSG